MFQARPFSQQKTWLFGHVSTAKGLRRQLGHMAVTTPNAKKMQDLPFTLFIGIILQTKEPIIYIIEVGHWSIALRTVTSMMSSMPSRTIRTWCHTWCHFPSPKFTTTSGCWFFSWTWGPRSDLLKVLALGGWCCTVECNGGRNQFLNCLSYLFRVPDPNKSKQKSTNTW